MIHSFLHKDQAMKRANKIDLTHQCFGKLTVLQYHEKRGNFHYWTCLCDCGKITEVRQNYLLNGHTKSCGCLRGNNPHHYRVDIRGQRFGKLIALEPTEKRCGASIVWKCQCDCGKITFQSVSNLKSGQVISCGCQQTLQQQKNFKENIHFVDGTCIEKIKNKKTPKNNTSGFRGVSQTKRGWIARIGFKGKVYYLGCFKTFEEAKKARILSESKFYDEFIEEYELMNIKG